MDLSTQSQERTIDGYTYRVQPLPFKAAKSILMRLLRLGAGIAGSGANGMGAAVAAVMDKLTDTDLDAMAKAFGDASFYREAETGGQGAPLIADKGIQDQHFAARLDAYLAWIMFSIEVNFARFFRGELLRAAGEQLATATASPSKSNP